MRNILAALALVTLSAAPSQSQVIRPTLAPPPCIGIHCLNRVRGATTLQSSQPNVQRLPCPQGTVYDQRKGTCHVVFGG
jgi:hypothetical protein